jgi:L-ascorbate metabolism protein UlaG (beta-lactamase superfamily)
VLWIGHSTTLIQTPHLNIITDPILFDSVGPSVFGINTVTNPGLIIREPYTHSLRSLDGLMPTRVM